MPPRSNSRGNLAEDVPANTRFHAKQSDVGPPFMTSVSAAINLSGQMQDVNRPPRAKPSFSRADVVAAIPAHCWERNTLTSFSHLAKDLLTIAALGYAATFIQYIPMYTVQFPLWVAYWLAQGCTMGGIWIIAHECGHQAFSESTFLNDTVGWFMHSALLVPYHSWKISHSKHHKFTCSVEHDEVFVPYLRSEREAMGGVMEDTPLSAFVGIFSALIFGWPLYFTVNTGGPHKHMGKERSHFSPTSSVFNDHDADIRRRNAWEVVSSDFGFFGALALIGYSISKLGLQTVVAYYIIPYLVVNAGLVTLTYLQHTDSFVPHYREPEFEWMRGALSTVDRSYGWLLDHMWHHIGDTHVVHHMFHQMPFYHAVEATKAVRPLLGEYYLRDNSPFPQALARAWARCKYIEDEDGIAYYKGPQDFAKSEKDKKKA